MTQPTHSPSPSPSPSSLLWFCVSVLVLLASISSVSGRPAGLTSKGDHSSGVVEMWASDPISSSMEITNRASGRVMDGDFVKPKNPQLEYRFDGILDFFYSGVKVSDTATWVDLGTETKLISEYNITTSGLELPVGSVFASIHFNNTKDASNLKNNLVVIKYLSDSRNAENDSTFQRLKEAKWLFEQPLAFNTSIEIHPGHIYLLRLVSQRGAGQSDQHIIKILVNGLHGGELVAFRYQVLFGDYSFEQQGVTGTSWWAVAVAVVAALLALFAAAFSVIVLGVVFVSRVLTADTHHVPHGYQRVG